MIRSSLIPISYYIPLISPLFLVFISFTPYVKIKNRWSYPIYIIPYCHITPCLSHFFPYIPLFDGQNPELFPRKSSGWDLPLLPAATRQGAKVARWHVPDGSLKKSSRIVGENCWKSHVLYIYIYFRMNIYIYVYICDKYICMIMYVYMYVYI